MNIVQECREMLESARKEIAACPSRQHLNRIGEKYLGREGIVRSFFARVAKLEPNIRAEAGKRVNELKAGIEEAMAAAEKRFSEQEARVQRLPLDPTIPGVRLFPGRRHPVYRVMEEICEILGRLGFEVVDGPEIETEEYNFEKLNMPRGHPSRDPWDSFYLEGPWLLRSHTSPVQIRTMLQRKPPFRILAPGRVYRPDTIDAGHLPMFHQVEGLMVGSDVTFAHLKSVLDFFAKAMFGPDRRTHFRPSYFPFTEPSAEVDVSCVCGGARECVTCRSTGWLEILGSGMVHPNVFRAVGFDPAKISGFAFGMGVERIAMVKYGVQDIRHFVENRTSFLDQIPVW